MTTTFTDLGVPADVAARLADLGRATPFPVQAAALPDALAGRDLCVEAPTGSGKTLAFALPVALRAGRGKPHRPRALLLVPTRELAAQVAETLTPLAQVRGRRVATVYGGTNITRDLRALRAGVDVLVATPGRLADLVQRGDADLREVDLVVIDEADRMADMGFLPEVKRLLDRTASPRQTLLFSATLDGDVDRLIRHAQTDPVRHAVAAVAERTGDVRHVFWAASRDDRRRLTGDVARRSASTVVFTRTKHGADRLARQLVQDGVRAAAIHGNRSQGQRERALAGFRSGEITALVATDVAARGIHVDDVAVVLHYDPAGSDRDYVHRSGRTGRAGADGLVITLVDDAQRKDVAAMQRALALPVGLHRVDATLIGSTARPVPAERGGASASPEVRSDARADAASKPATPVGVAANGRRSAGTGAKRSRSRARGQGRSAARTGGASTASGSGSGRTRARSARHRAA